jgi:hypothetical protein
VPGDGSSVPGAATGMVSQSPAYMMMPTPNVARTTKTTRTSSGSWRRWAAVPAATPASSRPERGRTNGGRTRVDPGGAVVAGVVTYSIVAPRAPAPTRVITLEEHSRPNQGRMGAFPDGFRPPSSAVFWS